MNKFWAKVQLKNDKNAEHLVRAFFREFNPESSITLRNKEARIEIFFENTPTQIVDAIAHCEITELYSGNYLNEYAIPEGIETTHEVIEEESGNEYGEKLVEEERLDEGLEITNQVVEEEAEIEESEAIHEVVEEEVRNEELETENEVVEEEVEKTESKTTEEVVNEKPRRGRPPKKDKVEKPKKVEKELTQIPEIEEFSKKATSFSDFVDLVVDWLKMERPESKKFFKELIFAGTMVENISWKDLKNALKERKVVYAEWDKIQASKHVSERLKEYSVTILPLVNILVQYKDYSFNTEETKELVEEVKEETIEEFTKEVKEINAGIQFKAPKTRIRMEGMPEIPEFEEVLGSVDMSNPIEKRVEYVLDAMGLKALDVREQNQILELASTAVKKGKMSFDIIFVDSNIPLEQTMNARMSFSSFVNNYIQKYDKARRIRLLDFLLELQKVVMFESEIEDNSDM